ncbi:UDP-N-acetylglucosamine--N-acetylmuramyl-(pentapeptide) pyrophosphoryl-undecaprenol N-acetylglucosamine transferase [Roseobacter fucihabitans]|uniref:UDP-N-acetylglucosamine--N-acetylmuramyl-(Pentapeptide) pyrophosphoryl-undecaprenol N-acetylglucosamine transferase n=1 Tax=Roseobacter fucihabitans TaxID=1537242 RepID=A0ABZ2BXI0_9RHOB|nr:glycosyltransferase [Roseobacter litoralis]MBC6964981.1 undecaprenyldiphospho-muramoylpentapeptide beta-N- acetylglucosaminyltransferase [Roseobacter litoralis]
MKVMIVVTHLLGTGHLSRALTLARAFDAGGHACTVVSGGMPAAHLDVTGVTFRQLPPLRSDGVNFRRLLDESGVDARPQLLKSRAQRLEQLLREISPDVLITELFPFGRRVLSAEFTHLLSCARQLPAPPLICASVRDILAPPSKPAKAQAAQALITTYYDAVLVHSDPDITPLDISWPVSNALAPYLQYTGFVAPPAPQAIREKPRGILVSAGGGDVGAAVFKAALDAAHLDHTRQWHMLVGGGSAQERIAEMTRQACENTRIEAARPDFRGLLQRAEASVSMAGYNTALDILQTGTPAVLIPFDAGGEVEQTLRATALSKLAGISLLPNADLTGAALLSHLDRLRNAPPRKPQTQAMDGARNSVRITQAMYHAR